MESRDFSKPVNLPDWYWFHLTGWVFITRSHFQSFQLKVNPCTGFTQVSTCTRQSVWVFFLLSVWPCLHFGDELCAVDGGAGLNNALKLPQRKLGLAVWLKCSQIFSYVGTLWQGDGRICHSSTGTPLRRSTHPGQVKKSSCVPGAWCYVF